jgi:hypothetical protein
MRSFLPKNVRGNHRRATMKEHSVIAALTGIMVIGYE